MGVEIWAEGVYNMYNRYIERGTECELRYRLPKPARTAVPDRQGRVKRNHPLTVAPKAPEAHGAFYERYSRRVRVVSAYFEKRVGRY